MKNIKRKFYFWFERLQVSRNERIAIISLMMILGILFSTTLFLNRSFNFEQDRYDELLLEFEKRSQLIAEEQQALTEKYNPSLSVNPSSENADLNPANVHDVSNNNEVTASDDPVLQSSSININTANSAELQRLNGIGEAYALRIINYRNENGPFASVDELLNIIGIGEKTLENIRPFIKLED